MTPSLHPSCSHAHTPAPRQHHECSRSNTSTQRCRAGPAPPTAPMLPPSRSHAGVGGGSALADCIGYKRDLLSLQGAPVRTHAPRRHPQGGQGGSQGHPGLGDADSVHASRPRCSQVALYRSGKGGCVGSVRLHVLLSRLGVQSHSVEPMPSHPVRKVVPRPAKLFGEGTKEAEEAAGSTGHCALLRSRSRAGAGAGAPPSGVEFEMPKPLSRHGRLK